MNRGPPQQAELLGLIPTIAQIGQLVVQQPHFEWIEILRDLGRVFRRPNLHRMLRKDIAQQLSQIEIAMGLRDTTTANIAPGGTRRIGGPGGQTRSFAGNASRSQAAPTAPQPAQRPAAAPQPQQTATL